MYSVVSAEQKNSRPECIDAVRELQFREQKGLINEADL